MKKERKKYIDIKAWEWQRYRYIVIIIVSCDEVKIYHAVEGVRGIFPL